MKRLFTLFFFLLHLICSGQILNASFENWTLLPDADLNEQQWTLDNWQHLSPLGDEISSLHGTYRDSTAQTGNFALGLSRWYNYTFDMALFRGACSAKPKLLTGFYHYAEGQLSLGLIDTALVVAYLTKYNPALQRTDTVGVGQMDLVGVDTFVFFQCPITYTQPNVLPDSLTILVQPTKFRFGVGGCVSNAWCSFLSVDDLALSFSTQAPELPRPTVFAVFPNPTASSLTVTGAISGERVLIFNLLGQVVYEGVAQSDTETLYLGGLKSGIYFLKINGKTASFVRV